MTSEIPKRYDPSAIEPAWRKKWAEKEAFRNEPSAGEKPYTIVIPPPNVTGQLHMGHGLNNTLQDVLIRHKRMEGYNTEWIPGTDHAGIATQNVVERKLLEENIKRQDLSKDEFLEKIWEWKETYGDIIIKQLQELGVSCDWSRQRFTMDAGLSRAVKQAFKNLYDKGLIYRGTYITNWCPRCRTALADDEVDHEDVQSHLWYISYPIKDSRDSITVATTRPETMLGDTAVAVNPHDARYNRFIGQTAVLPLVNREIPIIADDHVDPEFGTGAVKVTPAHDPNDYDMGLRHNLKNIKVIDEKGEITDQGIHFAGMPRFECREALVHELKEKDFLKKTVEHTHSVGHCYRCSTTIEPNLSEQWFVKMKPLARLAIDATLKNKVRFHPPRWKNYYLNWLENVRDWCISRQIDWGHRIPVWYCDSCGELTVSTEDEIKTCGTCESDKLRQDNDVLDTWFSSALWPFSTLGWPDETPDLDFYYPTSTLVTDRGIIYFWVARMVMMGISMLDTPPFSDVYIHGTILDEQGRKMSKSLGNGIDPLEMVETYGADAVRFALTYLTTEGQDVKLSPTQFEMGRNFMNKIWNASRFAMLNLEGKGGVKKLSDIQEPDFYDRWIISTLHSVILEVNESLDKYKYADYASACYDFFWHEFCDWYLEIIKDRMSSGDETAGQVLYYVLMTSYKLMHPMTPFITEELSGTLNELAGARQEKNGLGWSSWPSADEEYISSDLITEMDTLKDIIRGIRNIRANLGIQPKAEIDAEILFPEEQQQERYEKHADVISRLSLIRELTFRTGKPEKMKNTAVEIIGQININVPLEGFIDIESEKKKLEKQLEQKKNHLNATNRKLGNHSFLKKAPENVVNMEWERKENLIKEIEHIENFLENLE